VTTTTPAEAWQEHVVANCPHYDKVLVEGGYERTWSFEEQDDGTFAAVFHGLEDFGDEGDGVYTLRCSTCLTEFDLPDDWEWH
jgi:hypothetical protein